MTALALVGDCPRDKQSDEIRCEVDEPHSCTLLDKSVVTIQFERRYGRYMPDQGKYNDLRRTICTITCEPSRGSAMLPIKITTAVRLNSADYEARKRVQSGLIPGERLTRDLRRTGQYEALRRALRDSAKAFGLEPPKAKDYGTNAAYVVARRNFQRIYHVQLKRWKNFKAIITTTMYGDGETRTHIIDSVLSRPVLNMSFNHVTKLISRKREKDKHKTTVGILVRLVIWLLHARPNQTADELVIGAFDAGWEGAKPLTAIMDALELGVKRGLIEKSQHSASDAPVKYKAVQHAILVALDISSHKFGANPHQ